MSTAQRRSGIARWSFFFVVVLPLSLAFVTRPSFSPATISEQRARLPPPAVCTDEVAGIWRAHYFHAQYHTWYAMTLEVRRAGDDDNRLTGHIGTNYWSGTHDQSEPPPCTLGVRHRIIRQPATGHIADGFITFGGTTWATEREICPGFGSYNPDRFSGRIDPEIQEFQSVNNDGGVAVNVPVVFRRIRCFESHGPAHVDVSPPPFIPPRRSGCSISR